MGQRLPLSFASSGYLLRHSPHHAAPAARQGRQHAHALRQRRTHERGRTLQDGYSWSWVYEAQSPPPIPNGVYMLQMTDSLGRQFRVFLQCPGGTCLQYSQNPSDVTSSMNYGYPVALRSARGTFTQEASGHCFDIPADSQPCWIRWETAEQFSRPSPSDPRTYGGCGESHYAQNPTACQFDPVNSATGAFMQHATDAYLPGIGLPFAFRRSYTSADQTVGPLGVGWTDSYAASLTVGGNGDVDFRAGTGQMLHYTKQPDGSFVGDPGELASLSSVGGGYRLTRPDQVKENFDSSGRLTSIRDRNGLGPSFAYDGNGHLATITDSAGRTVTVTSNASGLISQLSLPDGRHVSYAYTGNLLSSVTNLGGGVTSYGYDAGNRLSQVTDPNSHVAAQVTYDSTSGRVTQELDALNNRTTFAWDPTTQTSTATDANGHTWKDRYSGNVLESQTDGLAKTTSFSYDANLNLTSVTDARGNATTMTYDARGNLLTKTAPAPLSYQQSSTYDAQNNLTSFTDGRGNKLSYSYDANGNLTAIYKGNAPSPPGVIAFRSATSTAASGTTITLNAPAGLAASDLLVAEIAVNNMASATITVPTGWTLVERRDVPYDSQTTLIYDHLAGSSEPASYSWTFSAGKNMAGGIADFSGVATANPINSFASQQNLSGASDPTPSITPSVSNAMIVSWAGFESGGSTLTVPDSTAFNVLDPNAGQHAAAGYLLQGTAQAVSKTFTNSAGAVTPAAGIIALAPAPASAGGPLLASYSYASGTGLRTSFTDARSKTWSYGYDSSGNLTSVTTPLGFKTSFGYDGSGRRTSVVDPRGNQPGANPATYTTSYAYDNLDRRTSVTDPLSHVTSFTYGAVGSLLSVTDANNHATSYGYDADNRLTTVTAPGGAVTTYAYDGVGNLTTRTDANNHATSYSYDAANHTASVTSPLGQKWTYAYDANGNRTQTIDANGNALGAPAGSGTTTYGYDALNRLISVGYSDSTPAVSYSYDADGNRTSMTDGAGSVSYSYDVLNHLTGVTRGSDSFGYSYDTAENLTQETYPGGRTISYSYDDDGRLASVSSNAATTSYGYDAAANLTSTVYPSGNGYSETRTYDAAGRLTEVKNAKGSVPLSQSDYLYDAAGNPTSRTALDGVTNYSYDARDRVTGFTCLATSCLGLSSASASYAYDSVGNRTTETRPAGTTSYTYNAADQLTGTGGPGGAVTYAYDNNGNETQAGSRSFTFDLANRPVSTTASATTTTYAYDGDGNRLQASGGGSTTNYLWDVNHPLPQLVVERDSSNGILRSYLRGADLVSMDSGGQSYYFHRDGLGSVANLTSATGQAEWTYSYEPFGIAQATTQNDSGAPTNPIRFQGELLDPGSVLYDLRARQYDPATGRFLSVDPLARPLAQPAISNYVYADERPTVLVDPSGMGAVSQDCNSLSSFSCIARWASQAPDGTMTISACWGICFGVASHGDTVYGVGGCCGLRPGPSIVWSPGSPPPTSHQVEVCYGLCVGQSRDDSDGSKSPIVGIGLPGVEAGPVNYVPLWSW